MKLDLASYVPIFEQIKDQIKRDISLRALKPNESLPTIRDLAQELLLNPNTVARAYRELESEGFIYTRRGKGSFVTDNSAAIVQNEREAFLNKILDKALEEARSFGLTYEEIKKMFDERLTLVRGREKKENRNE
jgi:GntR family transcriptional regulator